MGGYLSLFSQYWWPTEDIPEIDYKVRELEVEDGKHLYWWEAGTGAKRVIKGWFRYHPDELEAFHKKGEEKFAQLDDSILGTSSGHVTFMKVDMDKLIDLLIESNKRNIIQEFKDKGLQTKAFSHK